MAHIQAVDSFYLPRMMTVDIFVFLLTLEGLSFNVYKHCIMHAILPSAHILVHPSSLNRKCFYVHLFGYNFPKNPLSSKKNVLLKLSQGCATAHAFNLDLIS